jgi:hypothetical protein
MHHHAIVRNGELHVGFEILIRTDAAVQRIEQPRGHEHLEDRLANVVVFARVYGLDHFGTEKRHRSRRPFRAPVADKPFAAPGDDEQIFGIETFFADEMRLTVRIEYECRYFHGSLLHAGNEEESNLAGPPPSTAQGRLRFDATAIVWMTRGTDSNSTIKMARPIHGGSLCANPVFSPNQRGCF